MHRFLTTAGLAAYEARRLPDTQQTVGTPARRRSGGSAQRCFARLACPCPIRVGWIFTSTEARSWCAWSKTKWTIVWSNDGPTSNDWPIPADGQLISSEASAESF